MLEGIARLIYSTIVSLDGYVEDEAGNFDWAAPDGEVHAFANELERGVGTHLYGRRMYETMAFWETNGGQSAVTRDFAEIWRAADKIVYSRSLEQAKSARTRIERDFDPEAIGRMKESVDRDLSIGGPNLAAKAIAAGLVDEYQLLVTPVAVGGGKRSLPAGVKLELDLRDQRRFADGTVFLRYGSVGTE